MGPDSVDPRWERMAEQAKSVWQIWAGIFVAIGAIATVGLAVFETFWG